MSLREGCAVQFCGDIGEGKPAIGDTGKVLASAGDRAHVMWLSGVRTNQVDFIDVNDVVPTRGGRAAAVVDVSDTLAFGPMVTVAVRETYDEGGPEGLLTALNEAGHLAGLVDSVEHAVAAVAAQIREDDALGQVLASLDADEREEFVTMTAQALLRETFGSADD